MVGHEFLRSTEGHHATCYRWFCIWFGFIHSLCLAPNKLVFCKDFNGWCQPPSTKLKRTENDILLTSELAH